ncbi:MAG TPA: hypothetical protein VFU28_21670 [Vicinamibacterales bacterium]|nr:hypothetical protein [Vicinamibacterales bacterium]
MNLFVETPHLLLIFLLLGVDAADTEQKDAEQDTEHEGTREQNWLAIRFTDFAIGARPNNHRRLLYRQWPETQFTFEHTNTVMRTVTYLHRSSVVSGETAS